MKFLNINVLTYMLITLLSTYASSGPIKYLVVMIIFSIVLANRRMNSEHIYRAVPFLLMSLMVLVSALVNLFFFNTSLSIFKITAELYIYGLAAILIPFLRVSDVLEKKSIFIFLVFWIFESFIELAMNDRVILNSDKIEALTEGTVASFSALFIYIYARKVFGYRSLITLVLILFLFLFGQRAAILSLIIIEAIAFLSISIKFRKTLLFSSFCCISLISVLIILSSNPMNMFDNYYMEMTGGSSIMNQLSGRWVFWHILQTNFTVSDITQQFFGLGSRSSQDVIGDTLGKYYYPHNDHMKIIYDYGIIGYFLFITSIYFVMRRNLEVLLAFSICMFFSNIIFYIGPCITAILVSNKFTLLKNR